MKTLFKLVISTFLFTSLFCSCSKDEDITTADLIGTWKSGEILYSFKGKKVDVSGYDSWFVSTHGMTHKEYFISQGMDWAMLQNRVYEFLDDTNVRITSNYTNPDTKPHTYVYKYRIDGNVLTIYQESGSNEYIESKTKVKINNGSFEIDFDDTTREAETDMTYLAQIEGYDIYYPSYKTAAINLFYKDGNKYKPCRFFYSENIMDEHRLVYGIHDRRYAVIRKQ